MLNTTACSWIPKGAVCHASNGLQVSESTKQVTAGDYVQTGPQPPHARVLTAALPDAVHTACHRRNGCMVTLQLEVAAVPARTSGISKQAAATATQLCYFVQLVLANCRPVLCHIPDSDTTCLLGHCGSTAKMEAPWQLKAVRSVVLANSVRYST